MGVQEQIGDEPPATAPVLARKLSAKSEELVRQASLSSSEAGSEEGQTDVAGGGEAGGGDAKALDPWKNLFDAVSETVPKDKRGVERKNGKVLSAKRPGREPLLRVARRVQRAIENSREIYWGKFTLRMRTSAPV